MKTILFLFLILVSYSAKSQLSKGSLYLGGNLSTYSNKNESSTILPSYKQNQLYKSNRYGFSPSLGYFLKDKLAGGIQLIYNHNENEHSNTYYNNSGRNLRSNDNTSKEFGVSLNPFVRQYFSLGTSVAIFINASAFIGLGREQSITHDLTTNNDGSITTSDNESKSETVNWGANIRPGFVFFPSKKWSVEFSCASLDYSASKVKETGAKAHSLDLSYGVNSFNLGISYYLRSN